MTPPTSTLQSPNQALDTAAADPLHRQPAKASRPSRIEMVLAVADAANVTHEEAGGFIDLCQRAIEGANENGIYRMSYEDMDHHDTLSRIMPDESPSTPGSVHALIEHGLEATLTHTQTEDACAVAIGVAKAG